MKVLLIKNTKKIMMPEIPDVPAEPIEQDLNDGESRENTEQTGSKPEDPRKTEMQRLRAVIKDLESSPSANFLKEAIFTFTAERLMSDPIQRKGFIDNARANTPSLGQLLEAMAESAVTADPALLRRFERREITLPQVIEGTLDQMFGALIGQANTLSEPKKTQRIQQINAALADLAAAAKRASASR